jgi:hypothetical protein
MTKILLLSSMKISWISEIFYLVFQMQPEIPFASRMCLCFIQYHRYRDLKPYSKNQTVHRWEWKNSMKVKIKLSPSRLVGLRGPVVSSTSGSTEITCIFYNIVKVKKFRCIAIQFIEKLYGFWHPNYLLISGVASARTTCARVDNRLDNGWLYSAGKNSWAWSPRYRNPQIISTNLSAAIRSPSRPFPKDLVKMIRKSKKIKFSMNHTTISARIQFFSSLTLRKRDNIKKFCLNAPFTSMPSWR